jgi:hypothetical protein
VAAGGNTPASWRLGQNNKRTGELLGTLGQAGATRVGGASGRRVGFTMSADGRRQWRLGDAASRGEGRRRHYIGELKAVDGLTCAPRRREAVRVAAWVVGGDVHGRRPGYGGEARGRAAWQGRVVSAERGSRAVWRKWEGPRHADRWTEAGLSVRHGGGSVRDARHGAQRRARGRERLALVSCSIRLGPVQLRFTPNFSTEVGRVITSKVVDLLFLYNFRKRHRVFFSTICAQFSC